MDAENWAGSKTLAVGPSGPEKTESPEGMGSVPVRRPWLSGTFGP